MTREEAARLLLDNSNRPLAYSVPQVQNDPELRAKLLRQARLGRLIGYRQVTNAELAEAMAVLQS